MDDRLRFGTVWSGNPDDVPELEAMPFESLWVGGHVASPNPTPEAMVQLARLSAVARRVTIGTSILLLPLYPPAVVAKQIADIDRATRGRVVLGVGIGGEYDGEFRACQVPREERGARTDEAIPLLRKLWTAETIDHDGPHYAMQGVRIHPAPYRAGGPPVVVAGRKPPAMRRAATLGDGWMPYLYSSRRYADSVRTITELASEAGRDLTGFEWMSFLFVNVDADSDAAKTGAAAAIGGMYSQDFRAMIDSVAAAGTATEVADRIRADVDAGARHFVLSPATPGDRAGLTRRLVEDVLPRVDV